MNRKALCVVCGRPAEIENYCETHWLERQELFSIREFKLQICDRCGRWFDGKWHAAGTDAADSIRAAILNHVKPAGRAELRKVDVAVVVPETLRAGNATVTIRVCGVVAPSEEEICREKRLTLPLRWAKCDDCVKLSGRYHEAVFQLRGRHATVALRSVEELLRGKPYGLERIKEGYNVFIIHKGDASRAARELKNMGFQIIRSFKHVGQKKEKKLFRDVYAIR